MINSFFHQNCHRLDACVGITTIWKNELDGVNAIYAIEIEKRLELEKYVP
jgi:hypothetical protein